MARPLFILVFFFITWGMAAQEPLMPELSSHDSSMVEMERQSMYRQMLSGLAPAGEWEKPLSLPAFNFREAVAMRWSSGLSGFSSAPWFIRESLTGLPGAGISPFFHSGTVFSQGSYQVNDKFRLGGYSYGANSVFSAPMHNNGFNSFDTRGSTLFLQYKVNDKFKIETSINVHQNPHPHP